MFAVVLMLIAFLRLSWLLLIGSIWLHWYHLFRIPEPDDDVVERLTTMGKALLIKLERVLPFQVSVGKTGCRSMWCNEKVHSILHAPRTLVRMGREQNVSCQVTELRHKGVKTKGNCTNRNPATAGKSIMAAELHDSACQRMAAVWMLMVRISISGYYITC